MYHPFKYTYSIIIAVQSMMAIVIMQVGYSVFIITYTCKWSVLTRLVDGQAVSGHGKVAILGTCRTFGPGDINGYMING